MIYASALSLSPSLPLSMPLRLSLARSLALALALALALLKVSHVAQAAEDAKEASRPFLQSQRMHGKAPGLEPIGRVCVRVCARACVCMAVVNMPTFRS